MSAFNDNILLIRGLTNLPQWLFALLIKSKESNVKTWETTEVQCKNFSVLQRIADVAGISTEDLKNKQLEPGDIKINVEMVEKVKNEVEPIEVEITPLYKSSDFLAGRLAEKDATIEQTEKRIQEALSFAKKMEDHYQDMKTALERAQYTINEVLQPMTASLKGIPPVLDTIVRNSNEHDKEIMKALDRLVGNSPGTLEKESGKRILKGALEQQKKGK